MLCEKCKKNKAIAWLNKKSVCELCFHEIKGTRTKIKDYGCLVCRKIFRSTKNISLPLCSRKCRDKFNSRIKHTEDALKQECETICKGGEI